jgi:prephenate dehydrogenase
MADSLKKSVEGADLVLVCVPVRITPRILAECSKHMKSGSVLAEISSVKGKTFRALTRTRKDLRPLCLHPMFGPGASQGSDLKILLIPVRNEREELETAREFFHNANLVVITSAKAHDDAIGIVLGLTYFSNFALADFMASQKNEIVTSVAGTTFRLQSILAESIMTDEADLISVLIRDNPYALKHARQFLRRASKIAELAAAKDPVRLESRIRRVKSQLERKVDSQQSYKRLYSLMRSMDS